MANLKKTLRMCIFCKKRLEKKELLRLRCKDKRLVKYDNFGRSFYMCNFCIKRFLNEQFFSSKENKKIEKVLCNQCKNKDEYLVQLKEILTDVR